MTYGWRSTDGNGYRRGLRGALVNDGYIVNSEYSVEASIRLPLKNFSTSYYLHNLLEYQL
jgi:hypothetical protein